MTMWLHAIVVVLVATTLFTAFLPNFISADKCEITELVPETDNEAEEKQEAKEESEIEQFCHEQIGAWFRLPIYSTAFNVQATRSAPHFFEVPTPPPEQA